MGKTTKPALSPPQDEPLVVRQAHHERNNWVFYSASKETIETATSTLEGTMRNTRLMLASGALSMTGLLLATGLLG